MASQSHYQKLSRCLCARAQFALIVWLVGCLIVLGSVAPAGFHLSLAHFLSSSLFFSFFFLDCLIFCFASMVENSQSGIFSQSVMRRVGQTSHSVLSARSFICFWILFPTYPLFPIPASRFLFSVWALGPDQRSDERWEKKREEKKHVLGYTLRVETVEERRSSAVKEII
ncbi:hypothetical protein IWX90DRAFT_442329 [Phyllosticta citrichinensis]|uniref:Transmembrane protein n=1 Tax=Phyllosticta citrichinensis TaxID=1130410 RepID=A0ABR1XJY1_9PEZI